VLQLVLSAFEKLAHLFFDHRGARSITNLLDVSLVEVVSHESQRLWIRWLTYLTYKLLSVLVLIPWFIQKRRVGFEVEDSLLTFIDCIFGQEAPVSEVLVCHIFCTELQMKI
jgi:hypothetical protein